MISAMSANSANSSIHVTIRITSLKIEEGTIEKRFYLPLFIGFRAF
jgi:hypothetical protein